MRHGRTEFTNSMPPYLLYADLRSSGTDGGTPTAGAWATRTINTEVIDTHNLGTLSSNQMTLLAGTYRFRAWGVLAACGKGACRLFNVTSGAAVTGQIIESVYSFSPSYMSIKAECLGRFTIASSAAFSLQYWVEAANANNGLGVAKGFGDNEYYAAVEFWREP